MPAKTDSKNNRAKEDADAALWARGTRTVVRAFREDADVTQAQLAILTGWKYLTVVNLERGKKAMTIEEVTRIALALGKDPAAVLEQIIHWVQGQAKHPPHRAKR